MARVSTYLLFERQTEAAFEFYRSVFGGTFNGSILRMDAAPQAPGAPPLSEADRQLVMHVELEILGGHVLMGSDAPAVMGTPLVRGTHVDINLEPDTLAEGERLFAALADGGEVGMPLEGAFWGGVFGSLTDRFGTQWMVNVPAEAGEGEARQAA